MTLFIVSIIAGALTVLAPCILPLLPVVLGGTAADVTDKRRPFRIVFWLSLSVFVFTFLLRASTVLIGVPEIFWKYFAAGIIGFFGLTLVFPALWEKISVPLARVEASSNKMLAEGNQKKNTWGDIIMALALGPIFTTCSPTYFVILAAVLPESFAKGTLYILGYILGLAVSLLIIAYAGQKVLLKLNIAADPRGWFKRILGVLFIVLAIFIATGYDKKIETAILDAGFFDVTKVEQAVSESLLSDAGDENTIANDTEETTSPEDETPAAAENRKPAGPQYEEIVRPSGYVNSEPFLLKDVVGKKVILLDFMTYSCINCQRTFPYLNDWYKKYEDDGLLIVGIHTPEFSFEKNIDNVKEAAERFGLKFPLVLDNNYATWTAYANRYWPHKYLINIYGEIVYDHIGEGAYDETEEKIIELLNERKHVLKETGTVASKGSTVVAEEASEAGSPETYFGALRNTAYFGNGTSRKVYTGEFTTPSTIKPNMFYLGGSWNIQEEYITNTTTDAELTYLFNAKDVYIVAESNTGATVDVYIDGKQMGTAFGEDVTNGSLEISGSRLYYIFGATKSESHTLTLKVKKGTVNFYTFTFG